MQGGNSQDLTSLIMQSRSMDFSCAVREPFPCEIARICSDMTCESSVLRRRTSVFHCSSLTSAGLACPASIRAFSRHRVVIKIFVMMGPIHFSLSRKDCPSMSHSAKTHRHRHTSVATYYLISVMTSTNRIQYKKQPPQQSNAHTQFDTHPHNACSSCEIPQFVWPLQA